MSYDGKCYKLFVPVPEKQSKVQDIGYSKAEALEHCLKRGGKLLDISSQVKYSIIIIEQLKIDVRLLLCTEITVSKYILVVTL